MIQVKWIDNGRFVGLDSSKHSVVMSTQDEENGTGCKPSELLVLALGGCRAVDIVGILRKKRQELSGFEANLTAVQDPDPPWTFREIQIEYVFRGRGLSSAAIERAIELSHNKYCSVGATLRPSVKITHSYRIEES